MKHLLLAGMLWSGALLGFAAADAPKKAVQPNIVFFLIDDLGYADCGFNGGREIHTPEIDKLALGGAVLQSHYVQPVCSPTRAALLTGRYATHTGVYTIVRPHAKWGLPLAERTLATALKEAGYETAITGKWHLGEFDRAYLPTSRGFDHQYGHYFGAIDYFTHIRDGAHDWYRDDKELKEEGYSTHLVAREACRLIANKDKSKLLFLYVPFNGVHAPHQVPAKYLQPYNKLKGERQKYAGMLAAVDEAIGQIVAALETAGMRNDTLILFSADNGGPSPGTVTNNGPLRASKGTIYEGGVRSCAFASWPGKIPAGAKINEPLHAVDWYPTLVKLAGGSLEQKLPLDGRDVWPLLTEGAKSPHDAILLVQSPTHAAVRMGDWKLHLNQEVSATDAAPAAAGKKGKGKRQNAKNQVELYNLANDLAEAHDLAIQEPQRVASLRAKLDEFLNHAAPPGHLGKQDN